MRNDTATTEDASAPAGPPGTGAASATGKTGNGTKARTADGKAPPPAPDKPKKSTEAEVSRRVEEVLRIRIDGAAFADIREYAGEKGWGVSDSMLRKYIEKANGLLKERTERSRSHLLRLHLARREALYSRAVASADCRTALAVLADDAKLRGLYEDRRDLERQLAELLARLSESEGAARAAVPR